MEVDEKDGLIMPAEDWVEKEIMKSSNGWIEVNKDTLVSASIPISRIEPCSMHGTAC